MSVFRHDITFDYVQSQVFAKRAKTKAYQKNLISLYKVTQRDQLSPEFLLRQPYLCFELMHK